MEPWSSFSFVLIAGTYMEVFTLYIIPWWAILLDVGYMLSYFILSKFFSVLSVITKTLSMFDVKVGRYLFVTKRGDIDDNWGGGGKPKGLCVLTVFKLSLVFTTLRVA